MRIFDSTKNDPIVCNAGARIHALSIIDATPGATFRLSRNGDFVPVYRGEVLESAEGWDWLESGAAGTFIARVFDGPLAKGRPTASATSGQSGGGVGGAAPEVLHGAAANPIDIAAGTVVQVLDANPHRTTLTLQNGGITKLYWSLDAGLTAAGAGAEGALAAASGTDTGDGGFLSLPGWLGPVYVAASADGAARVRVGAY